MRFLTKDFVEFIECCAARDVRFLIVGGYALAAHGYPPATKDLDVWVWIDDDNADRLIEALRDFGFEAYWDRRLDVRVGSVSAGVVSLDDLVANKRASGRPQDLVDIAILTSDADE